MKIISILILVMSLIACSESNPMNGALLEREQESLYHYYYEGESLMGIVNETSQDKSAEFRQSYALQNMKTIKKIESKTWKIIAELEKMKSEVADDIFDGSSSRWIKNSTGNEQPLLKLYDFSESVQNNSNSDFSSDSPNGKRIQKLFLEYRKMLTENLVSTSNRPYASKKYSFVDSGIRDWKNEEEFNKKVTDLVRRNKVSLEDQDGLIKIYQDLSFSKQDWDALLTEESTSFEIIRLIHLLEEKILQARMDSYRIISNKFGSCISGFDKLMTIATGDDVVTVGDTLEISVAVGAFDSSRKPIVTCSNPRVIGVSTEEGMGKVKAIIPEKRNQVLTYSGNLTLTNKSGVSKTVSWEKKVWVK